MKIKKSKQCYEEKHVDLKKHDRRRRKNTMYLSIVSINSYIIIHYIAEEDKKYDNVLKVWNKFGIKTVKDYHDLYLKCDVLLLADVRNNSFKNYGQRPSYYLSIPALSWDAMVDMTKVKLELIPDLDMYILFQKSTRVSYISNSYSKYLKSYDSKQESKHTIYLDASNLFGIYLVIYLV